VIKKIINRGQNRSGFQVSWITQSRLPVRAAPIAVHDLTNAYHTDESLCNVEVLIENEGDAPVTRQRGGEGVENRPNPSCPSLSAVFILINSLAALLAHLSAAHSVPPGVPLLALAAVFGGAIGSQLAASTFLHRPSIAFG